MIVFVVDKLSHGCVGVPYKNRLEAIQSGSYSVWNDTKIKSGFRFGSGTYQDLVSHAKRNKSVILTEDEFYQLLGKLSEEDQQKHREWIDNSLNQI